MATLEIPTGLTLTQTSPPSIYDRDAEIFMGAIVSFGGSDLSLADKTRVNQLVLDLKSNSLWDDLYAFYPYIGGSAISTSVNLIDPGQYRINWYNSPIFETYGVRGTNTGNNNNGAYGDTTFIPAAETTTNQYGFGSYVQSTIDEANDGEHYFMGSYGLYADKDLPRMLMGQSNFANASMAIVGTGAVFSFPQPATGAQGLWHATRDGSNVSNYYFDGVSVGSQTVNITNTLVGGFPMFVLSTSLLSPTSAYRPTRKVMGFQFIDKGMDPTQVSAMKTVGDTYMSGR